MEFFLIYLFVMAESLGGFLLMLGGHMFWLSVFSIPVLAIGCSFAAMESYINDFTDFWNMSFPVKTRKLAKICAPVGIVFVCIANLIPTQQQLAIIVGSGVTYNVLTSEPAKQLGGKALELLNKKIDEALEGESGKGKKEEAGKEGIEDEQSRSKTLT